jgi:cell division protein FtsB
MQTLGRRILTWVLIAVVALIALRLLTGFVVGLLTTAAILAVLAVAAVLAVRRL